MGALSADTSRFLIPIAQERNVSAFNQDSPPRDRSRGMGDDTQTSQFSEFQEQVRELNERIQRFNEQKSILIQSFPETPNMSEQAVVYSEALKHMMEEMDEKSRVEFDWNTDSMVQNVIYEAKYGNNHPTFSDEEHPLRSDDQKYQPIVNRKVQKAIAMVKERSGAKNDTSLAHEIGGISRPTLDRLRNHPDEVSEDTVDKLCAAAGMTIGELRGTTKFQLLTEDATWEHASQVDVMEPDLLAAAYSLCDEKTKRIVTGILQMELRHMVDRFEKERLWLQRALLTRYIEKR